MNAHLENLMWNADAERKFNDYDNAVVKWLAARAWYHVILFDGRYSGADVARWFRYSERCYQHMYIIEAEQEAKGGLR
jgi:hypothetical protein